MRFDQIIDQITIVTYSMYLNRQANSLDLDQTLQNARSDQGLYCLQFTG